MRNYPTYLRRVTNSEARFLLDMLARERAFHMEQFRSSIRNAIPAFSANPAPTPIPAAGGWVYPFGGGAQNTLNATTTNASTAVTVVWPGTSGLYAGQPISGMGIAPNTTIASIGSATALTLSQNTTSVGTGTGNLVVGGLGGSAFTVNNNYGQPNPAAAAGDVPGNMFQVPELQTLVFNAASVFLPAPGQGFILLTSGATTGAAIQGNLAGTWTALFTGTAGAASPWMAFATDGTSIRITSPGTGNASFTFYRYRNTPI